MTGIPDNADIILKSGIEEIEILYLVQKHRPLTRAERLLLVAVRNWYKEQHEEWMAFRRSIRKKAR